jgi:Zn-finger protein
MNNCPFCAKELTINADGLKQCTDCQLIIMPKPDEATLARIREIKEWNQAIDTQHRMILDRLNLDIVKFIKKEPDHEA